MEKNDTDPDGDRAFDDVRDRTEPDPPRDQPLGEAAELLAKLSDVALPEDRVAETKGHFAAQFAAAPHAPPARRPDGPSEPSVLVNVTAPLPPPAPAIAPVASPEERMAVVLPRDVDPNTTVISPHRKRGNARIVAGAAVFATTVVVIAALASRSTVRPAPSSDPPTSSSALTSVSATTVAASTPTVPVASSAPGVAIPPITAVPSTSVAATASSRIPSLARPHGTSAPPAASAAPSARAPSPAPPASDDPDFALFQRKRQ